MKNVDKPFENKAKVENKEIKGKKINQTTLNMQCLLSLLNFIFQVQIKTSTEIHEPG